ncbi:hypothetical protein BDN72DRAFT_525172 [Pluteus cervinus]|uniref:Uncharacterized protein n=1 Tax=Pluteus cervinus TaxID=181527 RepID=A0ACD3AYH7_9AGAR|nr:hypothetical protein BDN72DRAFT_525172 [Pluteus cervinus]
MVHFPPEIIEQFFLYTDVLKTSPRRERYLRAWSLVSRTWRGVAQRILFSRVVLTGTRAVCSFEDAIAETPFLIDYIKWFVMTVPLDGPHPAAEEVLETLNNLRYLGVHQMRNYGRPLHPNFHSPLSITLSSKRLTQLSLCTIDKFPVSLFRYCGALQALAIESCTFDLIGAGSVHQLQWQTGYQRPRLDTFAIGNTHCLDIRDPHILEWFMGADSTLDFSKLKTFRCLGMCELGHTYDIICKFYSFCSSSLESIVADSPVRKS